MAACAFLPHEITRTVGMPSLLEKFVRGVELVTGTEGKIWAQDKRSCLSSHQGRLGWSVELIDLTE